MMAQIKTRTQLFQTFDCLMQDYLCNHKAMSVDQFRSIIFKYNLQDEVWTSHNKTPRGCECLQKDKQASLEDSTSLEEAKQSLNAHPLTKTCLALEQLYKLLPDFKS